ncbi:hypothetical protein CCM_00902 [Cordyceps militaris CM01]|uniref:Uncharacterized protein n=1 Tax=Cordyceps militaris (strain CM01) TaxID=983644 RepID=G3J6X0_CORMM|nr:uncharacterized protein CCM_00902 [Cordyceps militaris CM01]EGX96247.1 hypothetical protein CCM_00902 [Cordyceps militaris CM01]
MKVNFLTLAAMALANIPGAAAAPADAPMGIEITERDGVTLIREVPHGRLGVDKRCRQCVHLGNRCTIGDGSCYASEHGSCTWCGNHCKSNLHP